MSWHARLQIDYTLEAGRSVCRHSHSGPLRLLQSLYPEGDSICHNVLVHPPGGLVGGDTLELDVRLGKDAHALITTPGATRFYRSDGPLALQQTHLRLAPGARLEWLPLEALCYSGCIAENRVTMALEPGAELIGWDVTALGLPKANAPFAAGQLTQHIELAGAWLERGRIDARDQTLLNSPLGLAGNACVASLFFATGQALDKPRRERALDSARAILGQQALAAGVTSPNPQLVVLRVLAPLVEPAVSLLRQVRREWRQALWDKDSADPRIWST